MSKFADKYFRVTPWEVIEDGFDPARGKVSESIFSLGNELMGVRGFFEEGYSGERLIGSYFNGIYERRTGSGGEYKGIVKSTEFMVNSVNWLDTTISVGNEILDLAVSQFSGFHRVLDMKTGLLTRSYIWQTEDDGQIKLTFERLLSMEHPQLGLQRVTLESVDFSGEVAVRLGCNFGVPHEMYQKNFWEATQQECGESWVKISARTLATGKHVTAENRFETEGTVSQAPYQEEKQVGIDFCFMLTPGDKRVLTRYAQCGEDISQPMPEDLSFDSLLSGNAKWWSQVWRDADIQIEGDEDNQQGIRFCIFQMFQTYHGAREGNNIGAKGLTGEAYSGNAFWDTETYCLPFFLFQRPEAARSLLYFRYRTLPEAKSRAKDLDCEGAFYPIATTSGRECCDLWQHASLQMQASTGVAYGIWFYEQVREDKEFLWKYGVEMLVEISRMIATRGDWSADRTRYGFYGVMGPDEFQMMVNHNCYTNAMGKFTLEYTLSCLEEFSKERPQDYSSFLDRLAVTAEETADWKAKAERMYIPYYPETNLFEQHEGFFQLPHVDIKAIPVEDFPLYHHWTYDRIYRNDMVKQPDVLMLMLLFNHAFTQEQLKANYEYYEPRCIHESSLSPSVHSILACQLGKQKEAFDFFRFATRMDLDNYNRNTGEGLHTTSIAAAWMNIVYGFAGMRSDGKVLSFAPSLPEQWTGYQFSIQYRERHISLHITEETCEICLTSGEPLTLAVYGQEYRLGKDGLTLAMQSIHESVEA